MAVLKELPLVKKTRRWTKIFCPKKSVKEMITDVRHAQERTFNSLSKHVRKGCDAVKRYHQK